MNRPFNVGTTAGNKLQFIQQIWLESEGAYTLREVTEVLESTFLKVTNRDHQISYLERVSAVPLDHLLFCRGAWQLYINKEAHSWALCIFKPQLLKHDCPEWRRWGWCDDPDIVNELRKTYDRIISGRQRYRELGALVEAEKVS